MKNRGYVLLASLLIIMIMLSSVGFILLKTESHIRTSRYAQNQLLTVSLAETGIAEARRIIAETPIEKILSGKDGIPSPPEGERIFDPVTLNEALTGESGKWEALNDAGFFAFHPEDGSAVLIRISNDREEQTFIDRDGKLVVRSMGIVRSPLLEAQTSAIKNQVTVLEGLFRKEIEFLLPSPLAMFDEEGGWSFEGDGFEISGGIHSSITLLGIPPASLVDQLSRLVKEEKRKNFTGASRGIAACIDGQGSGPCFPRLGSTGFWNHFRENIGSFGKEITSDDAGVLEKGFYKYSRGSRLRADITGVLVTTGDVLLDNGFILRGLLIHLGDGRLRLAGNCRVSGAVLYSASGADGNSGIEVAGRAGIIHSGSDLETALACLPVTHLGTRIIEEQP